MVSTPLTPPSSGSEGHSPLANRQAGVSKRRPARRSSTGKFTWKDHHRRTLLVCHRDGLPKVDLARVFNTLYRDDCILAGYQDGISQKTLHSQWQDHRKPNCKTWQIPMASSDDELEASRREVRECLADIAATQRQSDEQWRTSTTNTRVQIFNTPRTPVSMGTATFSQDKDTIDVAFEPLSPASDLPSKSKRSIYQTSGRPSLSSVYRTSQGQGRSKAVNTYAPRGIANQKDKFPMYCAETRTRTVDGERVSLAKATCPDLIVPRLIRPEEAHSSVPVLLFRVYDDNSQGVRGPAVEGELAQAYACLTCDTPGPPPCDNDWLFTVIVRHLNCVKFTSEVISTTSNLFFAMTRAAKSTANPRIKIIRGCALPPKAVYHARPYNYIIKDKKWFFPGKWNNSTYHEYLVWAKIPQSAVLADFSFVELKQHLTGNPSMQGILRLDSLSSKHSNTNLANQFKQQNLVLSISMVEGLAKFLLNFSIDIRSKSCIIARLVSEVLRGFRITLPETTAMRWDMLAETFAFALTADEPHVIVSEAALDKVKRSFLSGLCTSQGDINWHLDPKKQKSMMRRGAQKGLDMSTVVLVDQIAIQQCRLGSANSSGSQRIIDLTIDTDTEIDDDVDEEEEEDHSVEDYSDEYDEEHSKNDTIIEDEEAETDIEVATPPAPRLGRLDKYKFTALEDEEVETDMNESAKHARPTPHSSRLDKNKLASFLSRQRERRRRDRRQSDRRQRDRRQPRLTPVEYNLDRLEEVFEIEDQSEGGDDEYTFVEVDEDDMEF